MAKFRCPGMDPAHFKPEDIFLYPCGKCKEELEFWKDDVKLTCAKCGYENTNPHIDKTCLSWCDKAAECIDNQDIQEWKTKNKEQ